MNAGFVSVLPFLGNKPTIIDGGANVGQSSREFLKVRIQSRIHAFEPGVEAYTQLVQQGFGPSVIANEMALSDFDGEADFHITEGPSEVASLNPRVEGVACMPLTSTAKVRCTRLDTYAKEHGLDRIHLLKLDLQGGEMRALEGAFELLQDERIDVIISEVWMLPSYKGAPYYWEIARYLQARGFVTWWIGTASYPDMAEGRWGDAAYVRKDLLESVIKVQFPAW
jgi:FkbM family methyltransferase